MGQSDGISAPIKSSKVGAKSMFATNQYAQKVLSLIVELVPLRLPAVCFPIHNQLELIHG